MHYASFILVDDLRESDIFNRRELQRMKRVMLKDFDKLMCLTCVEIECETPVPPLSTIYVIHRDPETKRAGLALVGTTDEPSRSIAGESPLMQTVNIHPVTLFDPWKSDMPDMTDIASLVCQSVPVGRTAQADDALSAQLADQWIEFMTESHETVSTLGDALRGANRIYAQDTADLLNSTPAVVERLMDTHSRACSCCGVDFNFVYSRFDAMPTMNYYAVRLHDGSRAVRPLCHNCTHLRRAYSYNELRDKTKMVTCNENTMTLQFNLRKGDLPS